MSTDGWDIKHGVFYDPLRCWTRNRSVVEAIRFNPMMISDEYLSTFTDLVVEVEPDAWVAFHINSNKFFNSKQNQHMKSMYET